MFQKGELLDSLCNAINNVEAFSGNSDVFPDSSLLPNGAPRFEECFCDDDAPTIEKSAASNNDSNKVENIETDLIGESTLNERSHNGIDGNVTSASRGDCSSDDDNIGVDNASCINNGRQKTHVASLKRRGCLKKPQDVALGEAVPSEDTLTLAYSDLESLEKGKQPVCPSRKQRPAFGKMQRATKSPNIISTIPCGSLSPLTRDRAKSLSVSTPDSLKLKKTRSGRVVVPALDPGCQNSLCP